MQLWDAGYPARIKHYYDMKVYSWKNTQFSQFNESDTLLLVSGVHFGNHSNTGEIAVFNLEASQVCRSRGAADILDEKFILIILIILGFTGELCDSVQNVK